MPPPTQAANGTAGKSVALHLVARPLMQTYFSIGIQQDISHAPLLILSCDFGVETLFGATHKLFVKPRKKICIDIQAPEWAGICAPLESSLSVCSQ